MKTNINLNLLINNEKGICTWKILVSLKVFGMESHYIFAHSGIARAVHKEIYWKCRGTDFPEI